MTLIQVLVGVSLVAILMGLAGPDVAQILADQRVRANASALLNGMQLARAEALRRNANVKLTMVSDGAFTVACETVTADCPATIYVRDSGEASYGVEFDTTPDDAVEVTFSNLGRRTVNTPSAPTLERVLVKGMFAGSRNLRVDVGSGGTVRTCDPAVPGSDARAC